MGKINLMCEVDSEMVKNVTHHLDVCPNVTITLKKKKVHPEKFKSSNQCLIPVLKM